MTGGGTFCLLGLGWVGGGKVVRWIPFLMVFGIAKGKGNVEGRSVDGVGV